LKALDISDRKEYNLRKSNLRAHTNSFNEKDMVKKAGLNRKN